MVLPEMVAARSPEVTLLSQPLCQNIILFKFKWLVEMVIMSVPYENGESLFGTDASVSLWDGYGKSVFMPNRSGSITGKPV